MSPTPTLLWLRRDLRLNDHPALSDAAKHGEVLPVYIHSPAPKNGRAMGAAQRWWLHQNLETLDQNLRQKGGNLVLRKGEPLAVLRDLIQETGAQRLVFTHAYDTATRAQDNKITQALTKDGIEVQAFGGHLLHEPWDILNKQGGPYRVYTPFAKACFEHPVTPPLPAPPTIPFPAKFPRSDKLSDWGLCPSKPDWAQQMAKEWEAGEDAVRRQLNTFIKNGLEHYHTERDRPDLDGVSRLSPYLALGVISPRQIWQAVQQTGRAYEKGPHTYLKELLWREFSYHQLYHQPDIMRHPIQPSFARFPWRISKRDLAAWQQGKTGYPIVDTGMRQLWRTGWIHNRVRMIVASFLVKDLRLSWQEGEAWFWDTLIDADPASNPASWQWVAGCGADAAPYFRIFNPTLQEKKYDPKGDYVRRYVPEWKGQGSTTYPAPLVDHTLARREALEALSLIKRQAD
ncbi:MAG: deoxyribodipyrimidine photo-lyase [Proteobacteria bacterium]|nr:deoxyribodipyrimidine photo-lyase [Pseudomonadota bacterium]